LLGGTALTYASTYRHDLVQRLLIQRRTDESCELLRERCNFRGDLLLQARGNFHAETFTRELSRANFHTLATFHAFAVIAAARANWKLYWEAYRSEAT
jgi:hypothetical protein